MLSYTRFAIVFTLLSYIFAVVGGVPATGLNAQRMARGLPPLPPVRRSPTPGSDSNSPSPSGISQCNTGDIQCCNTVTSSNDSVAKLIAGLLGIVLPPSVVVGLTCSPLSIVGIGGNSCTSQPVCCQNNSFNGVIVIGCTPININL